MQVASLTQLLPPRSPSVSNLALDSSLCRAAAPQLCQLQLLLPICVRFSYCSPITSASAAACSLLASASTTAACSLIVSALTAARPIVSASTAALQLHSSACSLSWIPAHVLEHSLQSSRFSNLKDEGHTSLV